MLLDRQPSRTESVTSLAQLEELAPAWEQLWNDAGASPFLHPAFQIPFARHFAPRNLHVFTLWRDARLIALAPFYAYLCSSSRQRKLLMLGAGLADHLDVLIHPAYHREVVPILFDWLALRAAEVDLIDLQQLPPDSPLLATLPEEWEDLHGLGEPCPRVDFPNGARTLSDALPGKISKNVRYYRKRAQAWGGWRCYRVGANQIELLMLELFRIHTQRWRELGEPGVVADPTVQAFHLDCARALYEAGLLRLNALEINGRVAAVQYGFTWRSAQIGGVHAVYLTGFDPFYSTLSPSTLLLAYAVEQALDQRLSAVDLLRGGESYKYLWGAQDQPTRHRKLWLRYS